MSIRPPGAGLGVCGDADDYWSIMCTYRAYSKDGEIHAFQEHDDIALLKAIRNRKRKDGELVLDAASLPKELVMQEDKGDEHGKFVSLGGLQQ
ncbi:hypothetical protein ES708_20159 [subsurface metagenome]